MHIRLTHLDGGLPNLALMKLLHYHRSQGDSVYFTRSAQRALDELDYDIVYASLIYASQQHLLDAFTAEWANHANVIVGGTGTSDISLTVEQVINQPTYEYFDYSIYPDCNYSLGFTSRGCRLHCPFCVVSNKEGRIHSTNTIAAIYRQQTPRDIVLLDNDFFGQPRDAWLARCQELIDGNFRVNLNQGINVRLITDEQAHWLSKLSYYDRRFKKRFVYVAWDNLRDETVFFRGISRLTAAGIPPHRIKVYMLIGFDSNETQEDVMYRFHRIVNAGMVAYPMLYNRERWRAGISDWRRDFQRWVVGKFYQLIPWERYDSRRHRSKFHNGWRAEKAGLLPPQMPLDL